MSLFRPQKDASHGCSSPPPRLSRLRHQSPTPQIRAVCSSPKLAAGDRAPRACRSADQLGRVVESNKRRAAKGRSPKREEEKKKPKRLGEEKKAPTEASAQPCGARKKKRQLKDYLLRPPGSLEARAGLRRKSPHRAEPAPQLSEVKKRELLLGLLQTMDSAQVQELIEWNQRRHLQRELLLLEPRPLAPEPPARPARHPPRAKKAPPQPGGIAELPASLKLRIGEIVSGRKKSEPSGPPAASHKGSRIMMRKLSKPALLKPLSHSKSAASDLKRKTNKSSVKSPGPAKKRKGLLLKKPGAADRKPEAGEALEAELRRRQRQKSQESRCSREAEKELNNLSEVHKRRLSSSSLEADSEHKNPPRDSAPAPPVPLHVDPQDVLVSALLHDPPKKNAAALSKRSAGHSEALPREDPHSQTLLNSKSASKAKSDKALSGSRLLRGSSEKKNEHPKAFDARDADSLVVIDRSEQERDSGKKVDECVQVHPEMLEALRPSQALEAKADQSEAVPEKPPGKSDRVERLAKEEYAKWSHVKSMLHQIEDKIGSKAASEVRDLFSKLDMIASQSKKSLREGFLIGAGDLCLSNQLSEIRTRRSEDVLASQLRDTRSPGHSPQGPVAPSQDGAGDSREDTPAEAAHSQPKDPQPGRAKMIKKSDMEVWPELSHKSGSGSPASQHHKSITFGKPVLGFKDSSQALSDFQTLSERSKLHKPGEKPLASSNLLDSAGSKATKPDTHHRAKIKVIEDYEAKADKNPSVLLPDRKLTLELGKSDLSPLLKESSLPFEGLNLPELDSGHADLGEPDEAAKLDAGHLQMDDYIPETNMTEDAPIIFGEGTSPRDHLRKYVESPANDMNWLLGDNPSGSLLGAKRDSSFDEEVKTCRKQFLAETITEYILNELLSELKSEKLYFKKKPPEILQQKVQLNVLDDPRYVSESSEEETIYGIRTNMNAVYEYCNLLVRFIVDNYMDLLLEKYNHKRPQNALQILAEIRERESHLLLSSNHWREFARGVIRARSPEAFLPELIFNSLEDEIISNYDNMNIMQELFEMQKVYHRSIFDCFNELVTARWLSLQDMDFARIVVDQKKYVSRCAASLQELELILNSCKENVVEYATMMCGIIRDKEDSLNGNLKLMGPERIDMIREDRLFRFLCLEALEMERKFTNYSMDEVCALIDCSEGIFDSLVTEVALELSEISKAKSSRLNSLTS